MIVLTVTGFSRIAGKTLPITESLPRAPGILTTAIEQDGRYVSVVDKNVLVVSTVEDADDVLQDRVGEADTIKVVVPVTGQSLLDWLTGDEKAFSHAEQVAEQTAERLPGETIEAVAGDSDVGLAIRDALATFPADEIVVAVRPKDQEGLVEAIATENAPRNSVEGVPVRYVVVPD